VEVAVEIRQLRYFVTVAEELHFGRAAERLHIVQPAVSQQVSRLERELGLTLLDRSPRRVALTADGQRLLTEARSVLTAVDRVAAVAAELAAGRAAGQTKAIRLGISAGLGERAGRGLRALRATWPDVRVELVDGPTGRHLAEVRDGALDLALVREPSRLPGLRVVEVWRDRLVAVLPAGHAAASGDRVQPADLAGGLLRLPARASDPALFDTTVAACREAGFAPCIGRPVGSLEAALVEISGGEREWTAVYASTPRPAIAGLAERPFPDPIGVPGYLVTPADTATDCVAGLVAAFT
jgi:DNA-binding transcriptional LysR family regulator